MAKMTSLSGSVTGKLAGNVYSVNAGQQIVRAYQPNVANPNTALQVDNRTKFKLASQLSAAVSPVLAISKQGLISGRNQFVSATMDAITFALGEATVHLNRLQLTKSSIKLPTLSVTQGEGNVLHGELNNNVTPLGVSKVIYAKFIETADNQLMLVASQVVSTPGADGHFATDLGAPSNRPVVVYAYGIIENENSILAKYGDYQLGSADFIASLISSRSGVASGISTTTTSCAVVSPA